MLVQAVASNPKVWGEFSEHHMAEALATGVLDGLTKDPTNLLSATIMTEIFKQGPRAISRGGTLFLQREGAA